MFKKMRYLAIIAVLVVSLLPSYRAFALNYSGSQGNPATFETLEEPAQAPGRRCPTGNQQRKNLQVPSRSGRLSKGNDICLSVGQSVRRARRGEA